MYPDEDLKSGMFALHERRCMWQCVADFYESGLLGRKFALMSMAFPGRVRTFMARKSIKPPPTCAHAPP